MTRRTPARPVAVEELFPELRPYRREAVRLHPRKGAPSCRDSSVGGPLLWPAEEQWPVCADAECPGGAGTPLVPIVQVHQAHAPGIPYPPGRDLLQVLWCPFDHGDDYCPLPQVHWRSAAVDAVLPTPPPPPDAAVRAPS